MVDDLRTKPDRDRVAALIAAADRLATPRDFEIIDRRPIRRGGVIAAIVIAAALVGLVGATALGGGGDATADDRDATTVEALAAAPRSDSEAIAASTGPSPAAAAGRIAARDSTTDASANPTASATTSPTATALDTTTDSTTDASANQTTDASANQTASATTSPTASATAGGAPAVPDPGIATNSETAPVRYAVYSGGKVYLRGRVPDRATAATIREKAAAVIGAGNVVDEYVIDPSAPTPRSAPLYVADGLVFDPDSDELGPAGRGLIDFGIALLQQNPGVTWIIEAHTDNLGSDAYNIELSQRRLDAIMSYIVDHGIDPRRLTTVAKGESEPIADNATRAGRAQNRRIEIIIDGLLD